GEALFAIDRNEQMVRAIWVRHPMIECRIEREDFLFRHVRELCGDLQIELTTNVHLREVRPIRDRRERKAMLLRIRNDALHREKLRNVSTSFARQVQAEEIGRLTGSLV